jgi:hypothetical protein
LGGESLGVLEHPPEIGIPSLPAAHSRYVDAGKLRRLSERRALPTSLQERQDLPTAIPKGIDRRTTWLTGQLRTGDGHRRRRKGLVAIPSD